MAKHILLENSAIFMGRQIANTLEKMGYEVTIQPHPEPDERWKREHEHLAMPPAWEDTVRLYKEIKPDAVIVDGLVGPEITEKLLQHFPKAVVIGCGTELNPNAQTAASAAACEKKLLKAGAKATVPLMTASGNLSETLQAALDKAMQPPKKKGFLFW